jgi:hypothetical protein
MAGRPPIYEKVEDMLPKLEAWEQKIAEGEKPTVTGLALDLGFCEKGSIYDYAEKPEFFHPLKRALLIVENGYEKALRENAPTGSIFALKNMGWKDKSEVEQSGGLSINWHEEKTYSTK